MQCKDIPELPILEFLAKFPRFHTANWFGDNFEESVTHAMPKGINDKLALAKMRQMIKKGLVDGCGCGCRGDFEITEKGREVLATR